MDQTTEMINAFKGGQPSRGSYPNAQTIAEGFASATWYQNGSAPGMGQRKPESDKCAGSE